MVTCLAGCLAGMLGTGCEPSEKGITAMKEMSLSMDYEKEISRIIKGLSLEEKVALLHGNGKFTSAGLEQAGIPEVQYTDGPLGVREEIKRDSWSPAGWDTDSATFFPASSALAATWNPHLARRYGEAIGREARARNKDILLAPAINIIRSPLCGRNYEYFSEDPFLISRMVVPYVQGVQDQDVATCVKHYAVNNQETNRGSIDVTLSERALREIYLPAFRAAVTEGGSYTVMGAYNRLRGDYLCQNPYMLNQILRKEWGFTGTVISDWGAVHSTLESARAGLDIEMGTELPFPEYYFADRLLIAVRNGDLDESVVDAMVRRHLRVLMKLKAGKPERKSGAINTADNLKLTYDVAAESIVLLKNGAGLLPLDPAGIRSLAVIGTNAVKTYAGGGFGAGVKARHEVTILDGLQNRLGNRVEVRYVPGYREKYQPDPNSTKYYGLKPATDPDPELMSQAVRTAASCDAAVLVIGTDRRLDTEGDDRHDMFLPFGQDQLVNAVITANPKSVVVVVAGGPFDLRAIDDYTKALIWTWFGGSEHGHALADVILGRVNPSGKMPFTIPVRLEESPAHALQAFPGDSVRVHYAEDIFVGYRWFDTREIRPMYPFGHGLSYTTFDYLSCQTDEPAYTAGGTIRIQCTLKNTGAREGSEIIEVYVSAPRSAGNRPAQELKGFLKTTLKAGEEQVVEISIPVNDLMCYDETSNYWRLFPGDYTLRIGSSSRDIRKEIGITISEE